MTFFLLVIFVLFPLATFLHEVGHYLTARLTGIKNVCIRVGIGPPILHINNRLLKLDCRLFYFIGAHTLSGRIGETTSFNRFLITLNGPLVNAVAATCLWGLYGSDSLLLGNTITIFAFINLWIAIGNLLPIKINNRKSDGYILLESLWSFITRPRQI
ncbi:site-2 protease family protein [Pseudalkalibacillus sp. A8]|uniref:site-2 protease family protein n=1 Tax=Pseudalkalibacillus sp. A8 TaxID=3382641 RepID=UPI0038B4FF4A